MSMFGAVPIQEKCGICDNEYAACVVDERTDYGVQRACHGEDYRNEIQRHGEGHVYFDSRHHSLRECEQAGNPCGKFVYNLHRTVIMRLGSDNYVRRGSFGSAEAP